MLEKERITVKQSTAMGQISRSIERISTYYYDYYLLLLKVLILSVQYNTLHRT